MEWVLLVDDSMEHGDVLYAVETDATFILGKVSTVDVEVCSALDKL